MPQLDNPKHERLVRAYIRHKTVARAARVVEMDYHVAVRTLKVPEVHARTMELTNELMQASDITAQRVMLELGRLAFGDARRMFTDDGRLLNPADMDDDVAASIAAIETEERFERDGSDIDLVTGELVPKFQRVVTRKIKRYGKDGALNTLAKHFKLVGDEGDGINALASALADRLTNARKRLNEGTDNET